MLLLQHQTAPHKQKNMNTPEKMHNALMALAVTINAKSGGAHKARFNNQYGQIDICAPITPFRLIGLICVKFPFTWFSMPYYPEKEAEIKAVLLEAGYTEDEPGSARFKCPIE